MLRVAVACAVLGVAGCSWMPWHKKTPQEVAAPADMQMLAVLPIEPASPPADDEGAGGTPSDDAGLAVTAQIYRVLADQTEFRFVADLAVSDVLTTPAVRRAGDVIERAIALGKEVGADGVIFGRVYRYRKRVGTEYGASEPASVSFDLGLVAVKTGQVVWKGEFDRTQQLPSNLFSWWMFWRKGPRWVSASELAGSGVDDLFEEMTDAVNTAG